MSYTQNSPHRSLVLLGQVKEQQKQKLQQQQTYSPVALLNTLTRTRSNNNNEHNNKERDRGEETVVSRAYGTIRNGPYYLDNQQYGLEGVEYVPPGGHFEIELKDLNFSSIEAYVEANANTINTSYSGNNGRSNGYGFKGWKTNKGIGKASSGKEYRERVKARRDGRRGHNHHNHHNHSNGRDRDRDSGRGRGGVSPHDRALVLGHTQAINQSSTSFYNNYYSNNLGLFTGMYFEMI